MYYKELKEYILSNQIDSTLSKLYCTSDLKDIKKRYVSLLDKAFNKFKDGDYHFISSPGRSEIGGNHTDHQHGHVLAASLNIDNLVVVKANNSSTINYIDEAYGNTSLDLTNLDINPKEYNTSLSLIRGIAYKIKSEGNNIGGFDGYCDSKVLIGSGISSSACFEVMIVEIFNTLFNQNKIDPVNRAIISAYSENTYFNKPSGLLDQTAISIGGFVAIDFKDVNSPVIENFDFSFQDYGYELLLINTKGDHADLTDEYASIPSELKEVSKCLNVQYLADSNPKDFYNNLKNIRETLNNDRALLRAIHIYNEDLRAIKEKEAIKQKDINTLLKLMIESGHSSYMYLQNVLVNNKTKSQSLALALALADTFLKEKGAYRVHGGGFEGTIQVVVPLELVDDFINLFTSVFGDDSILRVKIRPVGTVEVI